MDTITIPAYASDTLSETITLHAPEEWHERIKALAAHTVYGPTYRRHVVYALQRMSYAVRDGYTTVAYDWLEGAEQHAKLPQWKKDVTP